MLVKRKGVWVDIDGEEEGTLVDEEEEVLEEAGVDETPLESDEPIMRRRPEGVREGQERFEREVKEIMEEDAAKRKPGAWVDVGGKGKPKAEKIEEKKVEEKPEEPEEEVEEEGKVEASPQLSPLAQKLEIQKQKTEIAKLKKQEVEAGGGGLKGLVQRTAHGTRRTSKSTSKTTTVKSAREIRRGQRKRKADYSMYSISGMRGLATPGGKATSRSVRVRTSGTMQPASGGGLENLRKLSTPGSLSSPVGLGMPRVSGGKMGSLKPISLAINTSKMKPMSLGIKPQKIGGAKLKPMNLNIGKKVKPMGLAINTRKRGKIRNKRYNRNMRNILKIERI